MKNKYRVQSRIANPPEVVKWSGKTHRWLDALSYHTLSEAKAAVGPGERVIKICVLSEGAALIDTQAYRGRRFNIVVDPVTT